MKTKLSAVNLQRDVIGCKVSLQMGTSRHLGQRTQRVPPDMKINTETIVFNL